MHDRVLVILPPGRAELRDLASVELALEAVLGPYASDRLIPVGRQRPDPYELGLILLLRLADERLVLPPDIERPALFPDHDQGPTEHRRAVIAFAERLIERLGPADAVAALAGADAPFGYDDEGLFELSDHDPRARVDWWQIGGRFGGWLGHRFEEPEAAPARRQGDIMRVGEWRLDTFEQASDALRLTALVDEDGDWHDSPCYPFPPEAVDEPAVRAFVATCLSRIEAADPDSLLVLLDCHS